MDVKNKDSKSYYLYKEIIDDINSEDKENIKLEFTKKFKTPLYEKEEESKEFLKDSFFNSSCNSLSDIKLINESKGFIYEANFSVYYKEIYTENKKEQIEFNQIYEQSIENIKNKLNSEQLYVNNHSFFKKHMKTIIIVSLGIFILNSTISSFI